MSYDAIMAIAGQEPAQGYVTKVTEQRVCAVRGGLGEENGECAARHTDPLNHYIAPFIDSMTQ
jgi:hypothetical protein